MHIHVYMYLSYPIIYVGGLNYYRYKEHLMTVYLIAISICTVDLLTLLVTVVSLVSY